MIVSVAGGKGGVGKTLISASLAQTIAPVQFLDCDVEEPNAHLFLNYTPRRVERVEIEVPRFRKWKGEVCREGAEFCRYQALIVINDDMLVFPQLCTSCGGCFILCNDAVLEKRPHVVGKIKTGIASGGINMVSGELIVGEQKTGEIIKAVKSRLKCNRNAVVDCPPGNGRPALEAIRDSDFCLLVTETTPFAFEDLKSNKELVDLLGIRAGVVINKSDGNTQDLSGWALKNNLPILAEIPRDLSIARGAARGKTLPEINYAWGERLRSLWEDIECLTC